MSGRQTAAGGDVPGGDVPGGDVPGGDVPGLDVRGLDLDLTELIRCLAEHRATVGVAESLTGGLVAAALTSVAGASAVVRGGVVAYHSSVKVDLLGVDAGLLQRVGPVDPDVAAQMAVGCRRLLGATHGVATTGEAGPIASSEAPVGTYYVALAGPTTVRVVGGRASGPRAEVRLAATRQALLLLSGACTGFG